MSEDKKYRATARITITLDVRCSSWWDNEATVAQVMDQGGAETVNAVKRAMNNGHLDYKVIGDPVVGLITWEGPIDG